MTPDRVGFLVDSHDPTHRHLLAVWGRDSGVLYPPGSKATPPSHYEMERLVHVGDTLTFCAAIPVNTEEAIGGWSPTLTYAHSMQGTGRASAKPRYYIYGEPEGQYLPVEWLQFMGSGSRDR